MELWLVVSWLMKGVFNSRPPQLRYAVTWDVGLVLDHIMSLGRNQVLSLKLLAYKLAALLALSNASRASEIHALAIRYLSKGQDGISFTIAELTKTAQPGKRKKVYYPQLKEERTLCPGAALGEYLRRTSSLRGVDHSRTQLLLSVVKPFQPVSKSTIARWMKSIVQEAGVGAQYGAHSIGSAASTAAYMKGMLISDILSIADWTSDNVFIITDPLSRVLNSITKI